mmetsp:Transcript_33108/g.84383  ORF Transcript_33108/g.84383 Transcript_33108/m.84383 type:complete len:282 (-) Transcript_33108:132-977(-)
MPRLLRVELVTQRRDLRLRTVPRRADGTVRARRACSLLGVLRCQVPQALAHRGALGDAERLLGHRMRAHRLELLLERGHGLAHLAQLGRLDARLGLALHRLHLGAQPHVLHLGAAQRLLGRALLLLRLQLLLPLLLELPLELHRQQPLALGVLGGHVAAAEDLAVHVGRGLAQVGHRLLHVDHLLLQLRHLRLRLGALLSLLGQLLVHLVHLALGDALRIHAPARGARGVAANLAALGVLRWWHRTIVRRQRRAPASRSRSCQELREAHALLWHRPLCQLR